jgi:hypothetical protein
VLVTFQAYKQINTESTAGIKPNNLKFMFGRKGISNSLESTDTWIEHIVANRLDHSRASDFSLQEIQHDCFSASTLNMPNMANSPLSS